MFESHVTIEPCLNDRLDKLKRICAEAPVPFKVATLLKRNKETHSDDQFMTAHHDHMYILQTSMIELITQLHRFGFNVRRYKIEKIIVDSKYLGDSLQLLEDNK